MSKALAGKPAIDFQKPDLVISVLIDPTTGKLAAPDCPEKREEFYIDGTQLTEYCPSHRKSELPPVSPATEQPPANDHSYSPDRR